MDEETSKLEAYFERLKKQKAKMPRLRSVESPNFREVEIEAGLNRGSLVLKGAETDDAYEVRLREIITTAAPRLGMAVRILPQPLGCAASPITYEQLFETGTTARKKELKGKPNSRQQLYNTRYALTQFIRSLGLEITTAQVGSEFVTEFKIKVGSIINEITSIASRKKFQTEIIWWRSFYQKLLKEPSIPQEFYQAFRYLVDDSRLTFAILARFIGVSRTTLSKWYMGTATPRHSSLDAIYQAESIFNLPTGTLVSRIPGLHTRRRIRLSNLPEFLRQNPAIARKVRNHLPDDFCERPFEQQLEIVESIYRDIMKSRTAFGKKQAELWKLPYRLKEWPERLEKEFDDLALFKMADRQPIGMTRNGKWGVFTKVMRRRDQVCIRRDT